MRSRMVWVLTAVVLIGGLAAYFGRSGTEEAPERPVAPNRVPSQVAVSPTPPPLELRTPLEPAQASPAVAEAAVAPVPAPEDLDKPPPGDLNDWPGSKPLRRWLLKKAIREMHETAGTAQCLHRAQDVMVYSISSIMNSQGRSELRQPPFSPRDKNERYLSLNDRSYRPFVGEFPELDQFMEVLERRDGDSPRGGASPASARIDEISPELMKALELRAEIAFQLLQD